MENFKYYFNTRSKIDNVLNGPINKETMRSVIFHLVWDAYYNQSTNKDDIIKYIEDWMKVHSKSFHIASYASDIVTIIRQIKKMPWRSISEPIKIRKSELGHIVSFNDIRKEKILFCYLAVAKFYDASRDIKTHWESESDSVIFKMARVNIPVADRDFYIYDLIHDEERCKIHQSNSSEDTSKRIDFISDDKDDPVVIELNENNYRELAFTYLNWKNGGGYKECKCCGRLFKAKTNAQYCKQCSPKYKPIEYKTIVCIDCGLDTYINPRDTETCRCKDCYSKYRHQRKLETQRIRRQKLKE